METKTANNVVRLARELEKIREAVQNMTDIYDEHREDDTIKEDIDDVISYDGFIPMSLDDWAADLPGKIEEFLAKALVGRRVKALYCDSGKFVDWVWYEGIVTDDPDCEWTATGGFILHPSTVTPKDNAGICTIAMAHEYHICED